jgi:rubrerythrin
MNAYDYSLTALVREGYWFCFRCEKIVVLGGEKESPAQCPRCRKLTAEWQNPINLQSNN